MAKTDPRVDAYIDRAAEFARPILRHIRDAVHEASPEIEETIKWGFPHFAHKGIVCGMAAFKRHCALGFWKGDLILGGGGDGSGEAMGQFGRIASVSDLPDRATLVSYVRRAVKLNEDGVKVPRAGKTGAGKEVPVPDSFREALDRDPAVSAAFSRMSPSHRREYVEWIAEAKREETRDRRITTAIEWIGQGKSKNWKYERKDR